MEEHELGRDAFANEELYRLHCLRHSTSHVMAEAISRVFPEASFAIGPAIEDGFYYDVDVPRPITEDDLARIEAEMKVVVKRNSSFVREEWDKDRARAFFSERKQGYKILLIDGLPDATVTVYHQDGFTDLCRGPHVLRTGQCKHFKLLKVSGAYWRGDASGPQLQRVYGTVWPTKDELEAYLHRLEEARRRDHRKLGRELGLFLFHDWAPGAPFFLPKGEEIYHILSEAMRTRLVRKEGYSQVRTPVAYDKKLWEASGHWAHYKDNMFLVIEGQRAATTKLDDPEEQLMSLKPMNCPPAILIYKSKRRSYRELPMRVADQGVVHRNEVRGALGGLTRVRQLCIDDAHHFIAEESIEAEITSLLQLVKDVYSAFGLGLRIRFSTRPADKLGDDAMWDHAEGALENALKHTGVEYTVNPGDGAFYGPKIDFAVVDAIGREWQCATIQLDYQLPRRFDLTFVGADNQEHVPVMVHRAIYGSIERLMGILIEHYAGAFPTWLAPEQVRVMTVSEKSKEYGRQVWQKLQDAGIRVVLDDGDDKISYKIRECHGQKVPYMAILGEKEALGGTVSLRSRDKGDEGSVTVDDLLSRLVAESRIPF